jgi:hypothetical protein
MTNKAAFVDLAGGGGSDSAMLAWAHGEERRVILDGVVERKPPFSPRACIFEFAAILKDKGFTAVTGDRFSGQFGVEMFRECGIRYTVSGRTKSEIYAAFAILANSGLVQIPLHRKLLSQLQRLERRVMRGTGRENIDHAPGGHDDLSNAACGALVLAAEAAGKRREPLIEILRIPISGSSGDPGNRDPLDDYGFDRMRRGPSFASGRL